MVDLVVDEGGPVDFGPNENAPSTATVLVCFSWFLCCDDGWCDAVVCWVVCMKKPKTDPSDHRSPKRSTAPVSKPIEPSRKISGWKSEADSW